jgi:short-subunit dehydrogenase
VTKTATRRAGSVVVTGASAGVGRAVALAFARSGWKLGLLARGSGGLESVKTEIEQMGGQAVAICVDVADAEAVFAATDRIVEAFGAIDVWINNAMVTTFSPVSQLTPAEVRRVTEVTYLGYAFGTMAALKHMRPRNAGTIVQVGSALSYRAIPLQAPYCGAKFAIRGFTDALRSELLHDGSAIRLTMVQLPAVNTPQFDWARNKTGRQVRPLPPIHQPEAVAAAIMRAVETAPRELWVGFAAIRVILVNMIAPGLLDRLLARKAYRGQFTAEAPGLAATRDNLLASSSTGHATHGRFDAEAGNSAFVANPAVLRAAGLGFLVAVLLGALLKRLPALRAEAAGASGVGRHAALFPISASELPRDAT